MDNENEELVPTCPPPDAASIDGNEVFLELLAGIVRHGIHAAVTPTQTQLSSLQVTLGGKLDRAENAVDKNDLQIQKLEQYVENNTERPQLIAAAVSFLTHSLTQSRPSQQNCYGPQGTWERNSIIMVLNKIAEKPVHGTTIVPHDGQQSSMMNEKHVQKKPGVDHPIASVDDLSTYEVAH